MGGANGIALVASNGSSDSNDTIGSRDRSVRFVIYVFGTQARGKLSLLAL